MLSEGVKHPSSVMIKANGSEIELFYKSHPLLEDFFKSLLRSYSGLYNHYVKISEEEIARRLELTKNEVINRLEKLKQIGMIDYRKQKNHATITFLEERVEGKHLYLSPDIYRKRKEVAEKKFKAVMHFIRNKESCRSQVLLQYFGEMKSDACAACDICLKIHKRGISTKEFQVINKRYEEICTEGNLDIKTIFEILAVEFPEEKVTVYLRRKKDLFAS